jgi:hypothetical protein
MGADLGIVKSTRCAEECDVACFFYDSSVTSGFEYAQTMHRNMVHGPRCVFVAGKSDLGAVPQVRRIRFSSAPSHCMKDSPVQPEDYCRTHQLLPPLRCSPRTEDIDEVLAQLRFLASHPSVVSRLFLIAQCRRLSSSSLSLSSSSTLSKLVKFVLLPTAFALVGFVWQVLILVANLPTDT